MALNKRIKFRALTMSDRLALCKIYSDKEAMKYRGSKPLNSIEDASIFVSNQNLKVGNTLTIRIGVELMSNHELIGSVMYRFDQSKKQTCEIGYSIGRQYWGKGLGQEIVANMLCVLEKDESVNKIVAWSNIENIASIRILLKMGFKCIDKIDNQECYSLSLTSFQDTKNSHSQTRT